MNLASAYDRLASDRNFFFMVSPDGSILPPEQYLLGKNIHVFSGSFNPLHDAHRSIFDALVPKNNVDSSMMPVFEISIDRCNKEHLSIEELSKRLSQFINYAPVLITYLPLFIEKAGLLRRWNPKFHIGMDTAHRLMKYHGKLGVAGIAATFYVYPRRNKDGVAEYVHSVFENPPDNLLHADHPNESLLSLSSTYLRMLNS